MTTAPKPKWSASQQAAIQTTGRSLLVSAAAGSGKTSVLAERCAYLVCDAPNPCRVDELLVVTFTEAAAAEMRHRIGKALHDRYNQSPTPALARQLVLLDRAQISTLHSFCRTVIKQHFGELGIDPNFELLGDDEGRILRKDVAAELIESHLAGDRRAEVELFINTYGNGDDELIARKLVEFHSVMMSLEDPKRWEKDAIGRLHELAKKAFEETAVGKARLHQLDRTLTLLDEQSVRAISQINSLEHFGDYVRAIGEFRQLLADWRKTLKSGGMMRLGGAMEGIKPGSVKPYSNSLPGKELAKSVYDKVRKAIFEGDWRKSLRVTDAIQSETAALVPSAELLMHLVGDFSKRYAVAKNRIRALDYNDLERFAHELLARPAIARQFQRRFAHVLVDEYQDINELQDGIILRVCRVDAEQKTPTNLFCVGDVKQSIYRFRLAEPGLFLKKSQAYRNDGKTSQVIDLQQNFRSRAKLLHAINATFERLMTVETSGFDYDETHALQAGIEFPRDDSLRLLPGSPVELHLLPDDVPAANAEGEEFDLNEREALLIGQRIRKLLEPDASGKKVQVMEKSPAGLVPRDVRLGDVAILLRTVSEKAGKYASVLGKMGIRVFTDRGADFFEATEIRDLLAVLNLLDNQRQDIPLAAFLRSPLARIDDAEDFMASIRAAYIDEQHPVSFHDAFYRYPAEHSDAVARVAQAAINQIERWRVASTRQAPAELIWTLLQDSDYLTYVSGLKNGDQARANLLQLHEMAMEYHPAQGQGMCEFLRFLREVSEDGQLSQPTLAAESEEAVRIFSIHHSKGLEFPIVIIPDLNKGFNSTDANGPMLIERESGIGLSGIDLHKQVRFKTVSKMIVHDRIIQQMLAEELRALYVAMTRAREHLILVATVGPKEAAGWESRWKDHVGAFPPEEVLAAKSYADWIGPVSQVAPSCFKVSIHDVAEVQGWMEMPSKRIASPDPLKRIVALDPLTESIQLSQEAQSVVDRITFAYPHVALTQTSATTSVTAMAKSDALDVVRVEAGPAEAVAGLERWTSDGAELGDATHRFLQHMDYSDLKSAESIRNQITSLVQRSLLEQSHAKLIQVDDLWWFAESEIGQRIRAHSGQFYREVPVTFTIDPAGIQSQDPRDRVMVRARIDGLLMDESGFSIIDYKTDRAGGNEMERRLDGYRRQINLYAQSIEKLTNRPCRSKLLVLLHHRKIETA